MDDALVATNDFGMLNEPKQILSKNFDMKYMDKASSVIVIEIHRNRSQGILCLSQKVCINKILGIFKMKDCSPRVIGFT